jgi:hypothetical protein
MTFEEAMRWQAEFCDRADAPITARVCRALASAITIDHETGRRVIEWRGDYLADALPMRLVAAFHALVLDHRCAALDPLFRGEPCDDAAAITTALMAHDQAIAAWLHAPPQTNEPARSANFIGALLVLAERFGLPFDILEIGSSAGLNLLIDRYRYDLGGVMVGPAESPVTIRPEWTGPPPPTATVRIDRVRGVDISPLDIRDPAAANRLLAYVWADTPQRVARVRAAMAMIGERPVDLAQGDAADWLDERLAERRPTAGVRVLVHSIVWQYLPPSGQDRITAAMVAAGAAATAQQPLAWVAFETDLATGAQYVSLRCWPGDGVPVILARSHPHAAWIAWTGTV